MQMSEFQRQARVLAAARSVAGVDQGLRSYMTRVYGLMAGAMTLTGVVAYGIGTTPVLLAAIYGTPLKWVLFLAPLGMVFFLAARIHKLQASTAQTLFWVYAALVGASISSIFAIYTGASVAKVFFITAVAFLSLSLYGYTTRRDLSGMGSFLIMGVVGVFLAMLLNLFLQSPGLEFAISVLGVLIFAGLTAYDTQKIKNTYLGVRDISASRGGGQIQQKSAIMGALSLYLNFLNMFLFLLHFLGAVRE